MSAPSPSPLSSLESVGEACAQQSTMRPAPQFGVLVNPTWFAAATQALVILARAGHVTCASGEIADHIGSHAVFLRRVFAALARAGVVEAREGRDGGYLLARPAEQITLADVYHAVKVVEPSPAGAGACATEEPSPSALPVRGPLLEPALCAALDGVITETEAQVVATLQRHTIADLAS
ncbi:MAG TPA: Rrf2 family transcriptional regulator [Ktedonobacterales bacterium]|nr:Rrf2 family transcriptional regulator [Ktedonobacterales bacterium]